MCSGKDATFFIDTGSSVSLVSKSFIDFSGLTDQIRKTTVNLSSFTADKIKTYGEINLNIIVANCHTSHTMIITDLVDTHCLLGMDYLSKHNMNIDVTRQCITSARGSTTFLKRPKQLQKSSAVRSAKTCTIPPNTVMFIKAKASDCEMTDDYTYSGFIEPKINFLSDKGLLIDSAMCLTDNKLLPIRVTNLTDSPIQLYSPIQLGTLYPINNNCDSDIRGVQPTDTVTEQISNISQGQFPEKEDHKKTRKEWTKEHLWKELRINDITDITEEERTQLKNLVWQYRQCFSCGPFDLGECTTYEGDIQLKPGYSPSWGPARPIPYKLRDEMDAQIKGLEEADVIEKCKSKSIWNSPVFLVKKPHQPNKMRFVVDMRAVNLQCLPDNFQMPLIGHVVDKIAGSKWYSTFDCSQSFHQIKYNEKSRPITAFTTSNGSRYWFKRLIMGHKTSGAQFSRCMTKIMENLPFEQLIFFLDDLLLASDSVASHLERLKLVLKRLANANIKLSPSKSHFLQKQVNFVGITINEEGLKINDDRVRALTELKAPTDRKSLQSLLGFFGFNRKWIPQYATLTNSMYKLLRKGVPFQWTKECDTNLQKLKDAVIHSITLAVPDLHDKEQSYLLVIDGSKHGMGAHLSQKINGTRRVIGYFSKAVPNHKREWGQTKLELVTLFHAIKFWEPYLKGTNFAVKTDCLSLCNLDTIFRKNDAALRRKIQSLAEYSFKIGHLAGDLNYIADFWSRYPYKKKFKDTATQCNLNTNTDSKVIAQIEDLDPVEEHRGILRVVSNLCDKQNSLKTSPPVIDKDLVNDKDPISTDKPISTDGHPSTSNDATETTEGTVYDSTKSCPESVTRLIPPGFFCQRKYKCTVTRIKMTKESVKPPDSCTCDLIENDYTQEAEINAVNNKTTLDNNEVSDRIVNDNSQSGSIQRDEARVNPPNADSPDVNPGISQLASLLHDLRRAQDSDPILSTVKQWLVSGDKPTSIQAYRAPKELISYWKQFSLLSLKDGLIMRKWLPVNNRVKETERHLTCVPEEMRESVLQTCHASLAANHPGMKLTLDILRRYHYWPGMADDTELYVKACVTCGRVKQPQAYMKAKRQHIIAHKFNDILVIDHIEPEKLGITSSGNKYILSITDVWSGYVVAVATNSQKAVDNISLIMHNWVLRHGVPREIISDQAPGFRAAFYRSVLTALNCQHTYGLPYECKSTSKAERTNKRLNQSLRLVLEGKNPKLWDKYLNYVCAALNSLKSRHSGYSANFLVYGHELNTPVSLLLENGEPADVFDPDDTNPYNEQAYKLHKAYKDILKKVSRNLNSYYAHSDTSFNKGIRNTPFKAGDLCFVMIRCPVHKFAPRWYGPVRVVKVINDHVYVIKLQGLEKVINISKLKRYDVNKFSPSNLNLQAKEFTPAFTPKDPPTNSEVAEEDSGVEITVGSNPTNFQNTPIPIGDDHATHDDHQQTQSTSDPPPDPEDHATRDHPEDCLNPESSQPAITEETQQHDHHETLAEPETSGVQGQRPRRATRQPQSLQVDPKKKSYRT